MEPKLTNTKGFKTYLNYRNKASKCLKAVNSKDNKNEPLTTKDAVRFLLQGTLKWRVCRFCLSTTTNLSELDEILEVASSGTMYQVTIRDMIASFYPFQVADDPNFPNKICCKCLDRTINSYLFTQQCERAERALRNCFNDLNEKFDKLDPLERVKRRGRQKLHPNHNVLYADYKIVMGYADPIINIINVGASREEEEEMEISELECPKCWQVLPNIESYVNHEKSHPKSMWYSCRLCGKSFVKHSQYKKHIKLCRTHRVMPETDTNRKEFKCTECGAVTEEFGKHLQHIEKHKFKNILEHLIEKRMDDFCGVCMDKGDGSRMVELNETFHLHAGYPELTGERTLARVLKETVPEKSYKYEELYVAQKANILKVTKRCRNALDSGTFNAEYPNKNLVTDITAETGNIAEIIQKSNITFKFPQPLTLSNETMTIDTNSLNSTENVSDQFNHKDITDSKYQGNKLSFKIGYETLCKTCWIFNDPQCETCIKKLALSNHYNLLDDTIKKTKKSTYGNKQTKNCNMCWIFAKIGKCNVCKTFIEDSCTIEESDIETRGKIQKRRRDFNDNPERAEGKLKWRCNICFTSNEDRDTCYCCDIHKSQEEPVKFNFPKNINDTTKFQYPAQLDGTVSEDDHTNYTRKNDEKELMEKKEHDQVTIFRSTEVDKNIPIIISDVNMEVEVENSMETEHKKVININNICIEPMDVNYNEENIEKQLTCLQQSTNLYPIEMPCLSPVKEFTQISPSAIQFNIGVGSYEQQRYRSKNKTSQRRMNTVNNYIGTKICETCLNHALTCYIFLKKIRYTRTRLDTCIALMLKNLNGVEEPDTNVIVEIAEDSILPLMTKDEVVDDVEFDDSDDTFEGSMNVEVLEDEFRIESESSDDSVRSLRTYGPSAKPKNTKIFDDLKKNLYPVNPTAEFILHNPAKDATRTYVNKKLVNGIQPKLTATHEVKKPPPRDVCSEFLTFKKKPKPARRRWPRFTCPLCSKHFISDYFLKKHVLKHVEMKTKCPLCSARLKSKFCLFEHMKMVHIAHGVPYSVCTVCCRGFADASKLASHKKTHHGKECQLCGKRFSSQKRFDVHLQRHAVRFNALKGRKAQTCSFCEKECSNENELSLHVNKSHLQIKPYNCDMCDKQFYTEHNLASHKRVHTFLSREKCEFCDKVFKCRKDLVVHVRRHIGSKPHHCHVCRQSFYSETGRNVHMRKTHGGRFCCRLCKSVFNRKLDLKAHVNVAHNAM